MIVLNASVLIAHLDAGDAHHSRATGLLLDAIDVPLAASPLTLRVRTQLRLPDCCVLLAARTAGGYVATFDDRLHQAAAELGLVGPD